MAKAKKMTTVTGNGSRLEQLENLAKVLAKQIDVCANGLGDGAKLMPRKQYRETIKEIEEIRGVADDDDEIGRILSTREADGKSGAVR
ncbi:MAG: hypothetical protein ACLSTG_11790 [Clostridium sp.]